MKRYSFHGVHEIDAKPTDDIDGEWIRYSDHVEAMKRIAGDSAQEPDAWIQADHLAQAKRGAFMCRVEAEYRKGMDLVPIFAAPSASAQQVAQDECAQDVYERGQSIGLFDIPKETANAICAGIAAITGARVDWHYVGGRVHMKGLAAPAPSASPAAPATDELVGKLKDMLVSMRMQSQWERAAVIESAIAALSSASHAALKAMTDEDLGNLYWVSTGQSLRERDKRLAFAFGRAVESGVRRAVAEAREAAPPAALTDEGRMPDAMRDYIEGMSVSVDVSTGEHDAGNRYYGFVTEVMDDPDDKHGVTLLVQGDVRPNFKPSASPAARVAADDPTHDQLRAIARDARNTAGPSDDPGSVAYVLAGWRAACATATASPAALTDEAIQRAINAWFDDKGIEHDFELRMRNALLAASPADQVDWQPIETAPMDGTPVLLYARSENARAPVRVVGWWIYGQRWVECAFAPNHPTGLVPTHWMPLPTAPSMSATPPAAEE